MNKYFEEPVIETTLIMDVVTDDLETPSNDSSEDLG